MATCSHIALHFATAIVSQVAHSSSLAALGEHAIQWFRERSHDIRKKILLRPVIASPPRAMETISAMYATRKQKSCHHRRRGPRSCFDENRNRFHQSLGHFNKHRINHVHCPNYIFAKRATNTHTPSRTLTQMQSQKNISHSFHFFPINQLEINERKIRSELTTNTLAYLTHTYNVRLRSNEPIKFTISFSFYNHIHWSWY